jgi:uncharacterized membrane protein YqhA
LVIGYGLYELFIDEDLQVPLWLQVQDLDDLKSKLIGVVVAIISVIFVGIFVDTNRAEDFNWPCILCLCYAQGSIRAQ